MYFCLANLIAIYFLYPSPRAVLKLKYIWIKMHCAAILKLIIKYFLRAYL